MLQLQQRQQLCVPRPGSGQDAHHRAGGGLRQGTPQRHS